MKATMTTVLLCWAFAMYYGLAIGPSPSLAAPKESTAQQKAHDILEATGVAGGLIVHVGCGDGELTAALRATDSYLVHGLDTDPGNVQKTREYIRSCSLCGNVSAERFDGRWLPYVDNLVNLLVAENLGDVVMDEVLRVLCPGGVAYVKQDDVWQKTIKPRSDQIDDWTHYLYNSRGNAVSQDSVAGPPKHLQWVGSPAWTRHHDHMSSFNAMVSSGGRIFYILDEGPRSAIQLPAKWSLVARDAFNGTILWKRKLDPWHTHLWPLKSGPAQLPRRLVAVDDRVYVTLGLGAPLTALDAATGETIRDYPNSQGTEEIIYSDGVLFLLVGKQASARPWSTRPKYGAIGEIRAEPDRWAWNAPPCEVVAVQADSGAVLWKKETTVVPFAFVADDRRVLIHDGKRIVCLDRADGTPMWNSQPVPRAKDIRSWFGPTLVLHKGVVLFAGGERILRHKGGKDTMTALDAQTGEVLWTAAHPPSGYDSPEDLMVIGDLVWSVPMTNRADSGRLTGRNYRTGKVERSFAADDGQHMPHHRCHRAKATCKYLLASRTGIEYVDLTAQHWNRNDWVRGACLYGIMPANGLTYAPPHSCACYILAKLNGFNALAAAREQRGESGESGAESGEQTAESKKQNAESGEQRGGQRLERGPAFEDFGSQPSALSSPLQGDWPTYRHDAARSGRGLATVPAALSPSWKTQLGGKLSAVTVADGRLFVAAVDMHTVHALDAKTGKRLWHFTVGGRVDSPPTIRNGRVLFGSADGCVYCLRSKDGALAWRFRAAPVDRLVVAWEQIESAWPVHGSVLVVDEPATGGDQGIVYCVAGRSAFLDGGMRLLRLDAGTGRKISETIIDNLHPKTGKRLDANVKWPNLPVALPDILSFDGKYVYMRSQRFDANGQRPVVAPPTDFRDQTGEGSHLFCPTGFLDDSWWHRTYWLWGKNPLSAAGQWYAAAYYAPAGRIMVFDDSRVYAFGRKPKHFPQTTTLEYHLFRASKEPETVQTGPKRKSWLPVPHRLVYDWAEEVPLLGRGLVLAGEQLFVAGPPDLVDTEQSISHLDATETRAKLAAQAAALQGEHGALLRVVAAKDGRTIAKYELDSPPVFDGLATAYGRLYMSTVDGHVTCMAETQ